MALTIDIAANTRQAQAQVRDLGDELDSVADALDGVARDAQDDGRKIERALDDAGNSADDLARDAKDAGQTAEKALKGIGDAADTTGRDIDGAGDKLERTFRDMVQDAKKADREIEKVGDGGTRGFAKASEAGAEFKDEAVSNFSEIASSFDGSMESIGELAQGTLGGLASTSIPGIGIAAGIAAAGIGTITAAFEKVTEATEEAKESAYTYGLTIAASSEFATTAARIDELTGSVEGLKKIQDLATASGWEQKDVLNALATGDGLPALTKAFDDNSLSTNIAMGRLSELDGTLRGTAQGFDLAADGAHLNESAMYDLATRTGTATGKFDELGRAIYAMPDGTEIVVDAKTKTAKERLDDVAEQAKSMPDGTVKLKVDDTAVRNYRPPTKNASVVYRGTGRQVSWE